MADATFKSGMNYFFTYLLLVKDYVAYLGLRGIPVILGVVAAGLIYPLPFAIMAAAVYAMMAGHHTWAINFQGWNLVVDVNSAFLYALALAGLSMTFNYFMSRLALTANKSWQTALLWRAINQLPVMARWDTDTAVPLPLKVTRLDPFLTTIVRPGFLIGRIVGIGLPHFAITVGALFVLSWLDPISVLVLIGVALFTLPLYGWGMLRLVGVRESNARAREQQRQLFQQVLEQGVLSHSARRIDVSRLSPDDEARFSSGYGTVNDQLQGLNLVGLIVALHVVLSIAVIYVVNGADLSDFVKEKVFFFVVLLFMMRSALSLALLIMRLSRSYTDLANLRAFLYPKRKRVRRVADAPADAVFSLKAKQGADRHNFCKGKPTFVVMPKASYAFELLPLSNGLRLLKTPPALALRHIVFFDVLELESILDGSAPRAQVEQIKISEKKQTLHLPVCHASAEPEQHCVVALSLEAWSLLVSRDAHEDFCAERIVFVVISEPRRPTPPSPDTLLAVSDCVDIIAVGEFAETWDSSAQEAFQRASKKEIKVEFDEDVEMA